MAKKKSKKAKKNKALVAIVVIVVLLVAVLAVCLAVERIRTPLVSYVTRVYVQVMGTIQGDNAANNGTNNGANSNTNNGGNGTNNNGTDNGGNNGGNTPSGGGGGTQHGEITTFVGVPTLSGQEFSIHFPELGNKKTGDCTYLKIGDVDILIDAGSDTTSSAAIVPYVQRFCTDGTLEYVIVTHAHQDHIAGFVGSKANPGVFDSFNVGTIIEFAGHNTTSKIYGSYCTERDEAVARGATLYTALQCWQQSDGAQSNYTLAEGVSMQILYNYYYDHASDDENNYSVCTLFTVGERHFLFTGDLEEDGERRLVQNNELPKVDLFKGGHHGSYTANTAALMDVIQPKVVCVCCCMGTPEYTYTDANMFPSQAFFDHVLPYTRWIYIPTEAVWDGVNKNTLTYRSYNGDIVVVANTMHIYCSVDDTPVPQSSWFAQHRRWP